MIRTCASDIPAFVSHSLSLPVCCPVSANPRPGSTIRVSYRPSGIVLPVEELAAWITEYVDGHTARGVRDMERMIQDLTARVAATVGVPVRGRADLIIKPPFGGDEQTMRVSARATLTPPETAEAVPDDLTAAYMAGLERGRDELRAERDEAVKALETAREDTARLDYLDRCNQALNAHYGKTYRWELVQSHNVNRLMLGHMVVDLNDSAAKGLPSCRDAIDCARRRAALATEASR